MSFFGASPIGPVNQPDNTAIALRQNQRFAAEVIQVAGDRVLLAVDGVQIVARMTNMEQAAALAERRIAQFMVKDLSSQVISLQILNPKTLNAAQVSQPNADLIPNLLLNNDIEPNQSNLWIAKALLSQGLPVTSELVNELKAILDAGIKPGTEVESPVIPAGWGQEQAQIAAALKSAGLFISPGIIDLLSQRELPQLLEIFSQFRSMLRMTAKNKQLSPDVADLVAEALKFLDDFVVEWDAAPEQLSEKLRAAVRASGRSLENELSEMVLQQSDNLDEVPGERNLVTLARLKQALSQDGLHTLASEVESFLDGLKAHQYLNSAPSSQPYKEPWINLSLPLGLSNQLNPEAQSLHPSKLRVAYRLQDSGQQIDPSQSCMVIQVDLDEEQRIEIDLSIVNQKIGTQVLASNPELKQQAEEHLPELKAGLEKLGYVVQSVSCVLQMPIDSLGFIPPANKSDYREVNLKV